MRRKSVALAAIVVGISVGGCAESDAPSETEEPSEPPRAERSQAPGPPAMTETVEEATARIEQVLSSGDCEQVNALNPLSRPNLATEERCEALRGLAGLPVQGAAAYGQIAAVIDYRRGERTVSVLLVGDADGRYHVAFIDAFRGTPSVGTELAPGLDRAAREAVRALRRRDCEAFLSAAYRRFGLAGGEDAEVCERVETNPVATLAEKDAPTVKRLGGNRAYAFYALDTQDAFLTVIAAQQTNVGVPEGVPDEVARLPANAPEYGYLDALITNRP